MTARFGACRLWFEIKEVLLGLGAQGATCVFYVPGCARSSIYFLGLDPSVCLSLQRLLQRGSLCHHLRPYERYFAAAGHVVQCTFM